MEQWKGIPLMLMRGNISSSIDMMKNELSFPIGWELLLDDWNNSLCAEKDSILHSPYPKSKAERDECNTLTHKIAVAIAGLSFYPNGIEYQGTLYKSNFQGECVQQRI